MTVAGTSPRPDRVDHRSTNGGRPVECFRLPDPVWRHSDIPPAPAPFPEIPGGYAWLPCDRCGRVTACPVRPNAVCMDCAGGLRCRTQHGAAAA